MQVSGILHFYSHAHAGRDHFGCIAETAFRNFYSHAHAGRDHKIVLNLIKFQNFYSHAHAGRDFSFGPIRPKIIISTHTPTQGVTGFADFI